MHDETSSVSGGSANPVRPGDNSDGERPNAPASFIVEVTTSALSSTTKWSTSGQRFTTKLGAARYGEDLAMRWTAVVAWRVTASDDAPTDGRSEQWAERGAVRPDEDAPPIRVTL